MTFFYSMYGSSVESLSVYVRINGSEKRIWSRYGNHLSSNWTKACVAVNNNGTYQVISSDYVVISLKLLDKTDISARKAQVCVVYSEHKKSILDFKTTFCFRSYVLWSFTLILIPKYIYLSTAGYDRGCCWDDIRF